MQSYQFEDLPSNWSEPKPIYILVYTIRIAGLRTHNENIDVKYINNVPNVMFAAEVSWCSDDIELPFTLEHYDVWVNKHSFHPLGTAFIDQSVRHL